MSLDKAIRDALHDNFFATSLRRFVKKRDVRFDAFTREVCLYA